MKVEKVTLTKENLLKIKKLDKTFYTDVDITIEWYLERYNENHSGYFLYNENNDLVGYIVLVPIKKELYETITNGVIINDFYINPKMFVNTSQYYYIPSFLIQEEYRHQKFGKLLVESLKDLNGNICALTISEDGFKIASKYMKLKEQINNQVSIFIKTSD